MTRADSNTRAHIPAWNSPSLPLRLPLLSVVQRRLLVARVEVALLLLRARSSVLLPALATARLPAPDRPLRRLVLVL
jgi:hypothetical protein